MARAVATEVHSMITDAAATAPAGLTSAEARRRLAEFGPNSITDHAPPPWRTLLAKLWGPIPWMLEVAVAIQLARGKYLEAVLIGGLLIFNAAVGFIRKAGRARRWPR